MMYKFNGFIAIFLTMIIGFMPFGRVNQFLIIDSEIKNSDLYALSACLMDAETGRVLFGKNETEKRAVASTTKIATLIVALELKKENETVTISKYASQMPDVQMNVVCGETYMLDDLLYAMMLESFNDVAVAVAEELGAGLLTMEGAVLQPPEKRTVEESKACVKRFVDCMNELMIVLGCRDTHFVTPNGLDANDEGGAHLSTAYDMAKLSCYCIKNQEFNEIIGTKTYSFSELSNKRRVNVYNKDAFLDQMEGAFGIKTGFTGAAGYCFIGALTKDGRTFISVVLGSGWPGNKNYKWKDTRKLMQYGLNNYYERTVLVPCDDYKNIEVISGREKEVSTYYDAQLSMLLSETDMVKVIYELNDSVAAPVKAGVKVGKIIVYINEVRYTEFPILAKSDVKKADYLWFLNKIIKKYFLLDNCVI